jgi:hypothetical protein
MPHVENLRIWEVPTEPVPPTPLSELDHHPGNQDWENYEWFADTMEKDGYTWTDHKATTDDGYILTLFRLTGTVENGPFVVDKPPILIGHGLSVDAV